jgi:putative transposase
LNSLPVRTGMVRKRQRRLDGIGQIILSLWAARGLTTGEIAVPFTAVYGGQQAHISKITDNALDG